MKLLELRTTVGNEDDARRLADAAVGERLAACVHRRPVASVYRWAGQVQHDSEIELAFVTTAAAAPALRALILARHPYELPALYAIELAEASAPYREWVAQSTQGG
ncbi:MAG: divalent cation tolerance protein CutA [Rubrivivax sp.]